MNALHSNTPQRVGVLTLHRCINYGSYWQARCLVDALRNRGYNAVLLDHRSHVVDQAEWKCALRPVLYDHTPRDDRRLYGQKIRKFLRAFDTLPASAPFSLENPYDVEELDAVVVGSDEVWNLWHPWYGGYDLFFGKGLRAARLVSYAASFGKYPAENGLSRSWAGHLARFSRISVRDRNSKEIIERALGQTPDLVLDPCLQFSINPPEQSDTAVRDDPYVVIYGHGFTPQFRKNATHWAQLNGCQLVSVGYRNEWANDHIITAGPHEFYWLMRNARAVVTNFFHGCVFALTLGKPFVCETSDYRSIKIQNLMETVGALWHLMPADAPAALFEQCLGQSLDPEIGQNIARLRRASDAYLEAALS